MYKIKRHTRARDRWKNPQRAKDAAERLGDADLIVTDGLDPKERIHGMSDLIETLEDAETKTFTHTAKIPKDCIAVGCAMVILCEDPTGRKGVMVSGSPSMEPFFLQDLITSGDKMLKNLIRYTNPPKQEVSHIILPGQVRV